MTLLLTFLALFSVQTLTDLDLEASAFLTFNPEPRQRPEAWVYSRGSSVVVDQT